MLWTHVRATMSLAYTTDVTKSAHTRESSSVMTGGQPNVVAKTRPAVAPSRSRRDGLLRSV